ncbi:uncharacterized protein TNCV_2034851 [Trichonephila clavipes]|nr:uncharacterized protein TNCV_2034851 [Trichonephila clavipes]
MRSGDLLVETKSAIQSKSYLPTKKFLDSSLTVTPHRSLSSSHGVISWCLPPLMQKSLVDVLIRVLNLPATIKVGYLNCKIRPYIPNPLRCFKCQRFGHSQTFCRGQLTCSRCATVGHPSTDCTVEPKCVNCTQSSPSDSKSCSKWKTEKEIQAIKTNRNTTYLEARKLIVPQLSQTYAQAAKPSTVTTTTQTDENITKILCPPLKLLQPLTSVPKTTMPSKIPTVTKSSTSTQAQLLPSTSSVTLTSSSEPQPSIPLIYTLSTTSNNLSTCAAFSLSNKAPSSSNVSMFTLLSAEACPADETEISITNTIPSTSQDAKQTSKRSQEKAS